MTGETVLLERDGPVAIVTLNRPAAGNTVDLELATALERLVNEVAKDQKVRCVLVTGAGKLFCGGGDVAAFATAGANASDFLLSLASTFHRSIEMLAAMPKPLVTVVNGPAAGAGLSLAISGDLVLAARSAHFTAAYAGVGLTPDGGMSWRLPQLVGLRRAQEIILTDRRIDAEEAAAIGLVTRLVDDEQIQAEGRAVATALANGPVSALSGIRALLAKAYDNDLPTQLRAESASIANAGASADAAEGIAAFCERRKPDFIKGLRS